MPRRFAVQLAGVVEDQQGRLTALDVGQEHQAQVAVVQVIRRRPFPRRGPRTPLSLPAKWPRRRRGCAHRSAAARRERPACSAVPAPEAQRQQHEGGGGGGAAHAEGDPARRRSPRSAFRWARMRVRSWSGTSTWRMALPTASSTRCSVRASRSQPSQAARWASSGGFGRVELGGRAGVFEQETGGATIHRSPSGRGWPQPSATGAFAATPWPGPASTSPFRSADPSARRSRGN